MNYVKKETVHSLFGRKMEWILKSYNLYLKLACIKVYNNQHFYIFQSTYILSQLYIHNYISYIYSFFLNANIWSNKEVSNN